MENGDISMNGTTIHSHRKRKLKTINAALKSETLEKNILRQLAITEGGLIRDECRRKIWPILLNGVNYFDDDTDERQPDIGWKLKGTDDCLTLDKIESLKNHSEYNQVFMDVHRTLARFPPNVTDEERTDLQDKLTPLIVAILADNSSYKYYQGFHDVCLTALLVFDDAQNAYDACTKLAKTFFRSFLVNNLEDACRPLEFIYPIIFSVDRELYNFMRKSQVGVHFALSWLLTWFAHVIDDYKSIVRLYDLFVASHPLMPVYLTASVVLYRGNEIMSTECDMPYVHGLLSKMPKNLPLEALISDAQDLFVQYPPSKLPELKRLMQETRRARRRFAIDAKQSGVKMVVWSVAAVAAAYYMYNHYSNVFKM